MEHLHQSTCLLYGRANEQITTTFSAYFTDENKQKNRLNTLQPVITKFPGCLYHAPASILITTLLESSHCYR